MDGSGMSVDPRPERRDADHGALAPAFLATDLHLWLDGRHLVVLPRPAGTAEGRFPLTTAPLHVVTAWNPGGRRADPVANATADRALRAEVAELGLRAEEAEGRAPDGTWAERSLAIVGADEAVVLDLARRYGQAAIYRWTPTERAVVWCDDRPDDVQGWAMTEVARPRPDAAVPPGPVG